MKFYQNLAAAITGTAIVSALVITLPQQAQALTGEEINDIARNITVLIRSKNGHGSGFIIAKNGNTYYILTAGHVVAEKDDYGIVTFDKKVHQLDYSKVKKFSNADLAVIEFTSDENYQTAKLADSSTLQQGNSVFVSGWPRPSAVENASGSDLVRQFTNGQISAILPQAYEGYQISYTNNTLGGMSGGPVLDTGGRVVGIHGMGGGYDVETLVRQGFNPEDAESLAGLIKTGFNYAIPMNTFLDQAAQQRIYLNLEVETSPASPLGTPYQESSEPDPRDQMELGDVLNNINQGIDIIRGVCGIFGC